MTAVENQAGRKGLREKLQWIRTNIIDHETRNGKVDLVYAVFAILMLMNHVYVTLYFPKMYNFAYVGTVPICLFAFVSIILGRMWKDKGFLLMIAFTLIKVLRYGIESGNYFTIQLGTCIYVFGGCYAVGRALKKENHRSFIAAFSVIWTAALMIYAGLCFYVAWTGNPIANYANETIRIDWDGLIYPIYHHVQAGVIASSGIAMALTGLFASRKKWSRGILIIGIVMLFLFSMLLEKRVNYIVNAFTVCSLLLLMTEKKWIKGSPWKYVLMGILSLILFAALFLIQTYGIMLFNHVHSTMGGLISVAYAEAKDAIAFRGLQMNNGLEGFLSGRIGIWRDLLESLRLHPELLLWGISVEQPMRYVTELRAAKGLFHAAHTHNSWFQALLENGIPGFLALMGITIYYLKHGLQLIFNPEGELWQKMVSVTAIGCLLSDLVDITCYSDTAHPQVSILYLCMGLTVAMNQALRQKKGKVAEGTNGNV